MTNERVLIIDNDLRASTLLKTRIEAMGCLAEEARTAEDALYLLRIKWFDLIILDSKLKGRDNGISLLREIRRKKALANVPIIAQSDKVHFRKTFELMGVTSFFMKPYAVDVMLDEIKDILTDKVLILGEKSRVRSAIEKDLARLDVKTDIVTRVSGFYYNVITYRYKIVIVEYDTRPNMTDRMLTVIRRSFKNREAPIIVYASGKLSGKGPEGRRKLQSLTDRCMMLGQCEVMGGKFALKEFSSNVNRYLGIEA
ncbi:MAG: response regulator [Candidatus Omnitrophica bacterium]|nr:response regulator [Candidatus Omnitrophota bacterium]MDD5487808.1 response regulator [Candidatus Omnitrophota bacterium]